MLKTPILLPITLLAFLALLTFWINQNVQEQTRQMSGMQRHDPDYMLYHFVSTRTDALGQTRYVLAASEMRHYPDNETAELDRPRFTQFGKNGPDTQIQGQRGLVTGKGEQVEFTRQVKVMRTATETKGEMTLETERLIIEPDKDVAHTQSPVVIRQKPATVIHATGMYFDKRAETIQLFNRVHVHYERATPSPQRTAAGRAQKTVQKTDKKRVR